MRTADMPGGIDHRRGDQSEGAARLVLPSTLIEVKLAYSVGNLLTQHLK
jgi:hypothetical protein